MRCERVQDLFHHKIFEFVTHKVFAAALVKALLSLWCEDSLHGSKCLCADYSRQPLKHEKLRFY